MNKKIFLHQHNDFREICESIRDKTKASIQIVEKDYWIMHAIWALTQCDLNFELKGGTSLSKGWGLIDRFSEDVDIHIHPPVEMKVYSGKNHDKPKHLESRNDFYNWLSSNIKVPGAASIKRDHEWDDVKARNCGIAVSYTSNFENLEAIKPHILLEAGFAQVEPNKELTISSWASDVAKDANLDVVDNRAQSIKCYLPEYTFVEKLSAISGKFRQFQAGKILPVNFIRHHYDIYRLLEHDSVLSFVGSDSFLEHKNSRFRSSDESNLSKNEAFLLQDSKTREVFSKEYLRTKDLYYNDFPSFDSILDRIGSHISKL